MERQESPSCAGSHTCSLWGSQGSADALIRYLPRSRQRAQDGSPGASRLRRDHPAGPCPAAAGSAEHRGPAPRLVSRRRVARRLSCDLRAKRRVGQAPANGNGPFVGSGRVTRHIPPIPPPANCQRTASGGANTIGSLHSFNGVVVPNFSLRIVCEPCALATASTAEGTGTGKSGPLAQFLMGTQSHQKFF